MKGLSSVGQHGGRWKEDEVRAFHPAEFCLRSIHVSSTQIKHVLSTTTAVGYST